MYIADYFHVDINGILRIYCISDNDDTLVFTASRDKFNWCEDRGEVGDVVPPVDGGIAVRKLGDKPQ
jgi:hypothetical protein